jgi:hypothetical protein
MSIFTKSKSHELGSDDDPIRQGLFACQSMKELLQRIKLDGRPSSLQTIADAVKLASEGQKEEAISRLRSVLSLPVLETRVQLWAWSALRELGVQPDPKSGGEILGVVVEVPVNEAYDTLAGYQDGSARYLNFSGKAPDETIKGLCLTLLGSSVPTDSKTKARSNLSLPRSGIQVTLLTRSGAYLIQSPSQQIGKVAGALMAELIRRTKA